MKKLISIAIDGPAAAGKSTVAKIIAEQLSYVYIDTGAMYRTITYNALLNELNLDDEKALIHLLKDTDIQLKPSKDGQIVFMNGKNVTEEIRKDDISNQVSIVAKHKLVREEMVLRQQRFAQNGGVVMDGRDIGTHVLPDAEVKVFLLASVEERAKRRHEENINKGYDSNIEQIMNDIELRDKLDSEREIAPLKKAPDAIEIDTTSYSILEVVNMIMDIVKERI
ncbi:(d)CMP kinase [Cytobacillus sp. IB215665]|uniref:(d)CMP kinase n=1 Tax=Cytobacillus sp. IB215665 TaxID=3097357 RepID=UPI002A184B77|nr:(d)CMP kinase [Cytobacillus sp. IB215665]MDX8364833.1 (d)CMP kinase [Cytobacillus sp. IB215665]